MFLCKAFKKIVDKKKNDIILLIAGEGENKIKF